MPPSSGDAAARAFASAPGADPPAIGTGEGPAGVSAEAAAGPSPSAPDGTGVSGAGRPRPARGRPRRPRGAPTTPQAATPGEQAASLTTPAPRPRRVPRGPQKRPRLIETAGPAPGTPLAEVRLVVGTIIGPHGVRGEAKLRLATDTPEHLRTIRRVWVGDEEQSRRLLGLRFQAGNALIRLSGVTTPEQVDELRGLPVRIAGTDARPNEPGEYFLFQLIGLRAFDEAGEPVGVLSDVLETGAHDVFVISPETGDDILLPNHPDFVLAVQPEAGRLTVRLPVYA